ncbi:hypothetical protein GBA52_019091 [Prunus armeniaca]|nr:hypothetical protein GBA52_019091 [Prunus armeniaca]
MEQQQAKTSAGNHSQSAASVSTSSPENKSSQIETIPSPNPTPSSTGDAGEGSNAGFTSGFRTNASHDTIKGEQPDEGDAARS